MPNRQLSHEEIDTIFTPIFTELKKMIEKATTREDGTVDEPLKAALIRKIYKELSYIERRKPPFRKALKKRLYTKQEGKCVCECAKNHPDAKNPQPQVCGKLLPQKYSVLDRLDAFSGYNPENTRLICPECDALIQKYREYK